MNTHVHKRTRTTANTCTGAAVKKSLDPLTTFSRGTKNKTKKKKNNINKREIERDREERGILETLIASVLPEEKKINQDRFQRSIECRW